MLCRTTYRFKNGVVSLITEGGFDRQDGYAFHRVCLLTGHEGFRKSHFSRDDVAYDIVRMGYRLPNEDEVLVIDADINGIIAVYYVPKKEFQTLD